MSHLEASTAIGCFVGLQRLLNFWIVSHLDLIIAILGHRLFASSILPIDHNTLAYGSDNAGVRVLADPAIHEVMQGIGKQLYLKEVRKRGPRR